MEIAKIVAHNGDEFFCSKHDELKTFIENYRDEGERLAKEKGSKFLFDHIETIEIDPEKYNLIPASKYFHTEKVSNL